VAAVEGMRAMSQVYREEIRKLALDDYIQRATENAGNPSLIIESLAIDIKVSGGMSRQYDA
jgi:hypothetical protein